MSKAKDRERELGNHALQAAAHLSILAKHGRAGAAALEPIARLELPPPARKALELLLEELARS